MFRPSYNSSSIESFDPFSLFECDTENISQNFPCGKIIREVQNIKRIFDKLIVGLTEFE